MTDPDTPDLDLIVDEIEASIPEEPVAEEAPEESTAIVKMTADDRADRRAKAWSLHQRQKTYRQIGDELGVSIGTVKRDLEYARKDSRLRVELYDREDHVSNALAQYDDIIHEAWAVHTGADKETKLKALTLIRQTMQAKEKSLQNNGTLKKDVQVSETVQVSLVSKFDDEGIGQIAQALLGSRLNLHLAAPTLDIEEEEEENEE